MISFSRGSYSIRTMDNMTANAARVSDLRIIVMRVVIVQYTDPRTSAISS